MRTEILKFARVAVLFAMSSPALGQNTDEAYADAVGYPVGQITAIEAYYTGCSSVYPEYATSNNAAMERWRERNQEVISFFLDHFDGYADYWAKKNHKPREVFTRQADAKFASLKKELRMQVEARDGFAQKLCSDFNAYALEGYSDLGAKFARQIEVVKRGPKR